jgi:hypothetical protein
LQQAAAKEARLRRKERKQQRLAEVRQGREARKMQLLLNNSQVIASLMSSMQAIRRRGRT